VIRFAVQYFLLFTAMATVFPYFQIFLRAKGYSKTQVGDLMGLNSLAVVVGPLMIGWLADRFGQRRTALAACFLLFGLLTIPLNATTSYLLAAILVVGVGLTHQTTIPLSDTLASSALRGAREYGMVRCFGSLGFITTLTVVTLLKLIDEGSSTSMMHAMVVTATLAFAYSLTLPDAHTATHHRESRGDAEGGRLDLVFWLFVAATAFQRLGITAYYSFFTQYLRDYVGMERGAWVWMIGPIAEASVLFFGGALISRVGMVRLLIISMAAVSVRLLIYAEAPVLPAILPAQCLHALTFAAFHIACIEFLRRKFSPARRGMAMALYMSLSIALPGWIASSAGGRIIEHFGYPVLFRAYAVPPLFGIAVILLSGRRMALPQREWPVSASPPRTSQSPGDGS
jgi:PPP family 3-phenylpropionic acid transporter